MNIYTVFEQLKRPPTLKAIEDELKRWRAILVQMAEEERIPDSTDRENILRYLRDGILPSHPTTIEEVMKNFATRTPIRL